MKRRKLYKRLHLTAIDTGRQESPYRSYRTDSPIFKHVLIFALRYMHKKGSNRPKGYYHDPIGRNGAVRVEWSWTEELGYYAPEVSFEPAELALKCFDRIRLPLKRLGHRDGPEQLLEWTQAMRVKHVDDALDENGRGAHSDFRPLGRITDNPMQIIAYAAL